MRTELDLLCRDFHSTSMVDGKIRIGALDLHSGRTFKVPPPPCFIYCAPLLFYLLSPSNALLCFFTCEISFVFTCEFRKREWEL